VESYRVIAIDVVCCNSHQKTIIGACSIHESKILNIGILQAWGFRNTCITKLPVMLAYRDSKYAKLCCMA